LLADLKTVVAGVGRSWAGALVPDSNTQLVPLSGAGGSLRPADGNGRVTAGDKRGKGRQRNH
jgi:hypothetical protein